MTRSNVTIPFAELTVTLLVTFFSLGHCTRQTSRSTGPTFIGQHTTNEGGNFISAVTIKDNWMYDQNDICKWPSLARDSTTFGNHQSSFARLRGFLYKGMAVNGSYRIVRVDVKNMTCEILPSTAFLPFDPGEYWIDFFPDQDVHNPNPTFMGALQNSPTQVYAVLQLKKEFSDEASVVRWMDVKIKHAVRQIFGSYYDSEVQTIYIGFNEGHLFWDVPPSWLYVIDVKNKKVVSSMYNEHIAGFDLWFDIPSKAFYIVTMNDCAKNCTQGVREWKPSESSLSDVKVNFCQGTACFIFQVGYGYSYNPQNHTGVVYGGVSGYWHYNVETGELGQFSYDTVFPSNAVYVGPLDED